MPLVVLEKGKVAFVRGYRPRIGCRASENQITQQYKQLLNIHNLSASMYRVQSSLLKGKK
jgi:hypothetical protein